MVETKYMTDETTYLQLISDSRKVRADNMNEQLIVMKIRHLKSKILKLVFVLHHLLHQNGKVGSCDTDSALYTGAKIETSGYCGDIKNELSKYGPNAFIKYYVSTGEKSYGYVFEYEDKNNILHHKESIKAKGIHNPKYTVKELLEVAKNKCKQINNVPTMTFKKHVKDENNFKTMQTVYGLKKVTNTLTK